MWKKTLLTLFVLTLGLFLAGFFFPWSGGEYSGRSFRDFLAGTFFVESVNAKSIQDKYTSNRPEERIKILIVPGHDNESYGTSFKGLKEADLNADLAKELVDFLKKDPKLSVILVRDRAGYNQEFNGYFERERETISSFVNKQKVIMGDLIRFGLVSTIEGVVHNDVTGDNALRLYAVNVWANVIGADMVIHIHFNDYPRRRVKSAGEYSGFAVYIPERQYSNAPASRILGEKIFEELGDVYPPSDLPKEDGGLVEDQELIALGANNTLDGASVLIEYGYIYEPYFLNERIRTLHLKEMALKTHRGIIKFLGGVPEEKTILLPYRFEKLFKFGEKGERGILSLQAALLADGVYPPKGKDMRECPLTGSFRGCTVSAVKDFQKKYGIAPTGAIGPITRAKLNQLYGEIGLY